MKPVISIIIPAYNAEQTLKRCLDSVFDQDFGSYEVILVNDGSTDGTIEIALQYQDHPNFVLIDQPNGGEARARGAGIYASEGDYLAFVDADDFIAGNMISRMFKEAERNKADIVVCNLYRVIDEEATPRILFGNDLIKGDPQENITRIIMQQDNGSICNKFWRRGSFLDEHIEKTFGVRYGADLLLSFYLLLEAQTVVYISDPLYYNVQRDLSASQNPSLESIQDCLEVFDKIKNHIDSTDLTEVKARMPVYYLSKLLQRYRQLGRIQDQSQRRDLLKKRILEKCRQISFLQYLRSRPNAITCLQIVLIKLYLYQPALSIRAWLKRTNL